MNYFCSLLGTKYQATPILLIRSFMTKERKSSEKGKVKPQDLEKIREKSDERHFGGLPDRDLKKNLGCG